MMITRSKWRPLKRSSMLNMLVGFTAGLFCRQLCTASALCSRTGYKVFAPEPGHKSSFGFMNRTRAMKPSGTSAR
jgi:hypothetical protein